MISFYFFTVTAIIAFIVRVFEIPYIMKVNEHSYQALYTYANAFYMTFITITTVGYGDIKPKTVEGRAIMMLATLIGTLLISLIVLSSTTYLNLDCK
jgi:voltage-gated potassium channel